MTSETAGQGFLRNLRGYVQIAIDRGMLEAFPASVKQIGPGQFQVLPAPRFEPNTVVTRGVLASKLNLFAAQFAAGNQRGNGVSLESM